MKEQKSLRRKIAEKIEKDHLMEEEQSLFQKNLKDLDFFENLERDSILATADAIIKMVKRDLIKSNTLDNYLDILSNSPNIKL